MRYRNMKTGDERDFIQGMKIDPLWKPIQTFHTGGRSTVTITEIHPDDIKADLPKTIMGEDKAPEKKSRRKASIVKAVQAAKRKEAREKAATEAEIVS
jgi:hypothetical protein